MTEEKEKRERLSPTETGGKTAYALNDFLELTIGGVTYRVRSVFAGKSQIGDLFDLAAIEKIARIA